MADFGSLSPDLPVGPPPAADSSVAWLRRYMPTAVGDWLARSEAEGLQWGKEVSDPRKLAGEAISGALNLLPAGRFGIRRPGPHPEASGFGWALEPDRQAPAPGLVTTSATEFRPYSPTEQMGKKTVTVNGDMVSLADIIRAGDGNLQIHKIETLPAAQRRGYATALMRDLMEEFPQADITTSMQTKDGRALFRSLGGGVGYIPMPRSRMPFQFPPTTIGNGTDPQAFGSLAP